MKDKFILILRLVLGSSFILSGITKIFSMTSFIDTVYRFNVLPEVLNLPFSVFFPVAELVFGVALVIGYLTKFSSFSIMFMLIMMLAAIVPQLLGGPEIGDCGCFGGLMDSAVDENLLIRDILLFSAVYLIFVQDSHILTLDSKLKQA